MIRSSDRPGSWSLVAAVVVAACVGACTAAPAPTPLTTPRGPATAPTAEIAARQILVTFVPRPALDVPRAGSSPHGYRGPSGYQTTARSRQLARQLGRAHGLTEVAQWPIETLGVHCVVFAIPDGTPRAKTIARLEQDERVESVQPMHLFSVEGRGYDDPYLDLQQGIAELGLVESHRWVNGAGVRVAVIDTGVDLSHPELAGRIVEARDFVSDARGPLPAEWHGTAVAGIIASASNNGIGIVGVAPGVEILALRGCWPQTSGSAAALCSSFTLAKALSFAVAARPQVINLSLGGPWDPLLERLVRSALAKGILVVAARGETPDTRFPSGVAGVVAVLASPPPPGGDGELNGELAAPGREILTTVPNGGYDFVSGSSLAAAQVSGVAALLLEGRRMKPAGILALLRETARPGAAADGKPPVVNACAALARLKLEVDCS